MQATGTIGSYKSRKASHAGSWYTADKQELDKELTTYLGNAKKSLKKGEKLRGIIGPHAGFSYSGPTAAWAYINIDPA
jgi:AmmeMemoRadiSam system protein B